MKQLLIKPDGWPCTLLDCPPGLFVFNDTLCFKSEYTQHEPGVIKIEAFCESGEFFWGGSCNHKDRNELIVQPVVSEWVDEE